jgi:hypothetical protein
MAGLAGTGLGANERNMAMRHRAAQEAAQLLQRDVSLDQLHGRCDSVRSTAARPLHDGSAGRQQLGRTPSALSA